jgi:processive 1,2-diacylglycerol beta-glucosyltransferase
LRAFAETPELINRASDNLAHRSKSVSTLSKLNYAKPWYSLEKFVRRLRDEEPSVLLTTTYQPTEIMEEAVEQHLVKNLPTAYIQTDYGRNHYLARVVPGGNSIDKVFGPTAAYIQTAEQLGVRGGKLVRSGMPISPAVRKTLNAAQIAQLRSHIGLVEGVPTIFLGGGSFGLGKFGEMLDSISKSFNGREVQVVVATGRNKNAPAQVEALRAKLPNNVKVLPLGFTPDMAMYQKYLADVVVTKAGGLTTTELTYMRKNMVLIRPAVNFERANLRWFVSRRLALSAELSGIGEAARRFIDDQQLVRTIRAAQDNEMKDYHPEKIAQWSQRAVERQNARAITKPYFADERTVVTHNPTGRLHGTCEGLFH